MKAGRVLVLRTPDERRRRAVPAAAGSTVTVPPVMRHQTSRHRQRGGFGVGLIVGLLVGLALALGVALYVTKVPVPFVNKVPLRSPGQDAAEAEKNRNWDPNSPLYGKNPARPSAVASGVVAPPATLANTAPTPSSSMLPPALTVPPTATTPPAIATGATPPVVRSPAPAVGRDPAAISGDRAPVVVRSAPPVDTGGSADPFTYFIQAGAFGTPEDAEQQRARLAMMGLQARLSEREQAGRTVHRVRLGPFDSKADADATKEKLGASGIEAALVRVQR